MTNPKNRFAAILAVCAMTLTQLPSVSLPAKAEVDNSLFEGFDMPLPTTLPRSTMPATTAEAEMTSTTTKAASETTQTTARPASSATSETTITSTAPLTTASTVGTTSAMPALASSSDTSATTATTTTATTATEPVTEDPFTLVMPEDPDMPDFSYLGEVGNLTQEQTEFIARSVFLVCKNPNAYPHEGDETNPGKRRLINLEVNGLEIFLADNDNREETKNSIMCVIDTVIYNHKECMLADINCAFTTRPGDFRKPEHFAGIYIGFKVPEMMYEEKYAEIQKKFQEISSLADPEWSDVEKALFFHDYLAVHCNYDFISAKFDPNDFPNDVDEKYYLAAVDDHYSYGMLQTRVSDSHYAYGMLENHYAVCQGYAWLYNLLLNENGVESYFVSAQVENPKFNPDLMEGEKNRKYLLNHAWNLIKIDGHYYHTDLTWDDQGTGIQTPDSIDLKAQQVGYAGQVKHKHFLVSTEELKVSDSDYKGDSKDWVTTKGESAYDLADTMMTENTFWLDAKSIVMPFNGGWLLKKQTTKLPEEKRKSSTFKFLPEETIAAYTKNAFSLYTRQSDGSYRDSQLFVEQTPWIFNYIVKKGEKTEWIAIDGLVLGNYSTFAIDGEYIFYTSDGGKGLHVVYFPDLTNMESSMVDRWLFNGTEYGLESLNRIYGISVEEDKLRLFTGREVSDTPVVIEIPMDTVRERIRQVTTMTLPTTTEPTVKSVPGDFSGDGTLDVADVVSMSKTLTGNKKIPDADTRQRMDLVADGVIDIYDLGMLKRLVLQQK